MPWNTWMQQVVIVIVIIQSRVGYEKVKGLWYISFSSPVLVWPHVPKTIGSDFLAFHIEIFPDSYVFVVPKSTRK